MGLAFNSEGHKSSTMRREAGESRGDPYLLLQVFRYGIQYRPTAERLRNTYMQATKRGIVFYNLPEDVPICRVLAHVRGGTLRCRIQHVLTA